MSLEMCHLLFIHVGVDLKKLLENALRFETPVVLNICHQDTGTVQREFHLNIDLRVFK